MCYEEIIQKQDIPFLPGKNDCFAPEYVSHSVQFLRSVVHGQPGAQRLDLSSQPLKRRTRLEAHKIPVAFEWIDEIPKTDLGKPRRHLLRAGFSF